MENNRNGKTSVMVEHKTSIREITNLLRNENIVSEDYHIVLFLLSLYRDNLLPNGNIVGNRDLRFLIKEKIMHAEITVAEPYLELFPAFENLLDGLRLSTYHNLYQIFDGIEKDYLNKNFSDLFDEFLQVIIQASGKYGAGFSQPKEITQLINNLVEIKKDARVFNPFAGLASFGVSFSDDFFYYGQEFNKKTWALGTLRLLAYNRYQNSKFNCEDSLSEWPSDSEKFDLIVSNPPFSMRISNSHRFEGLDSSLAESFVIEKGLNSLTEEGQLIAIVPNGFLFRETGEQAIRRQLVVRDYLDTVIQLPAGLLPGTGIPITVIVINKNKKTTRNVRFIDARKFVVKQNRWAKILDIERLKSVINGNYNDDSIIQFVDNETIRDNDYNLNVPRYLQPEIEGVKLNEILTVIRGDRRNIPVSGKLVRIRDLSDSMAETVTGFDDVLDSDLLTPGITAINQSCLLLATIGNSLKPTVFEYKGEPIYIRNEILACKVMEDIADITFVASELNSPSVLKQLDAFNTGAVISRIRKSDLVDIVIQLPSLQEQKAKIQGLKQASEEAKELRNIRNELAHGISQKQFNEYASLKHTLGTPRQNILDWSNNLIQFFELKKNQLEDLDADFKDVFQINMKDAVSIIRNDINFMTEVLERGEKGLVLSEYPLTNVKLVEIKEMIENLSSAGMKFNLVRDFDTNVDADDLSVTCNLTLLKILISNILTNADRHGFDNYSPANEVVISLYVDHSYLNLEIKNNGKPFPKNFGKEKFIEKFSKSGGSNGSGIGGNDIDRIATYFSSDHINTLKEFRRVLGKEYEDIGLDVWDLILNEDPIYPVIFKFSFKIWGTAMTL